MNIAPQVQERMVGSGFIQVRLERRRAGGGGGGGGQRRIAAAHAHTIR